MTSFHAADFPLSLTISCGNGNVVKCIFHRNGEAELLVARPQHDRFGLTEYSERAEQIGGVQGSLRVRIQSMSRTHSEALLHIVLGGSSRATRKGLAWPPCVAHLLFCAALELLLGICSARLHLGYDRGPKRTRILLHVRRWFIEDGAQSLVIESQTEPVLLRKSD